MSYREFKHNLAELFFCGCSCISPYINTRLRYFQVFGKRMDLEHPVTLNDKVLWLKLHKYRGNQLIKDCADKYAVRNYIEQKGCPEILNDLIASYDTVEEIEWDKLPYQFAMKWNFGCGFNIICPDKSQLDIPDTIRKMKEWGKKNAYLPFSEVQYEHVKKKIIVEKYLSDGSGKLPKDYKIYCFNGKPSFIMVCVGREEGKAKYLYYDHNWNLHRELSTDGMNMPADFKLPKPDGVDEMLRYAAILSEPFEFVRADFYLVDGKTYFGELTFTPSAAMDSARVPAADKLFGDMVKIEELQNK